MAKLRVTCPECGLRHTVKTPAVKAMSLGVRARRVTANQFEYSLSAPAEITEEARFVTVGDDLILAGAFGCAVGALAGWAAATVAPEYAIQAVGVGASAGVTLAWGWLCAERNQRLKRVLPWFLEQRENWKRPELGDNGEVQLTVDHIHRDSYSEGGRSIALLGVLPVSVDSFAKWAEGAIRGDSLAIKQWTGAKKPFSRQDYDNLLSKMREAGIVAKLPGKGHVLTNPGRHALKAVLREHPPTPLGEGA